MTTLDRQDRQIQTTAVNLEIAAVDTNTFVTLDNVYTRRDIPIKEANMGTAHDINKWSHLRDICIPTADARNVMLLIGQDNPDILLPREVRSGNQGEPYATRSLLGWTINGPLGLANDTCRRQATSNFVTMDDTLQRQVETFWKVDGWEATLSEKPSMSIEDHQAIDIWEKSIQKKADHYVLDIPFRSQPPDLPVNRDVAETRLRGLKKRLLRDREMRETYTERMQDLLDKEYAEPVVKDTRPDGDPEIKRPRNVTARSYLVDVTRPAADIDLLINSYSTWYKLKRGIAWMLRFKSWLLSRVLKHPSTDMNRALDVMDLRSAENAVVKYVQFQQDGKNTVKVCLRNVAALAPVQQTVMTMSRVTQARQRMRMMKNSSL